MIAYEEIFKLSVKSIVRNKTRSILTMLGLIIGVGAVILLISLGQGLQNYITNQFEDLGSNLIYILPGKTLEEGFGQGPPNIAGSKLTQNMVNEIKRIGSPIEDAASAIESASPVKNGKVSKFTTIAGVSETYTKIRNINVERGRVFNESDITLSRNVAVIGKTIEDKLFGQNESLGQNITIGKDKFKVIGILQDMGAGSIGFDINNFIAIPITSAQQTFGIKNVQTITVKAQTKEDIPQVISMLKTYFKTRLSEDDYSVMDQNSLLNTINQILGVLTAALGGIAAISLVVGGVGIMNIMLVSVTERTREIGLRKAVGAKPSDILSQFIIEAVTLSVTGGSIGIAIGWLGSLAMRKFIVTAVTPWSVILAFSVSAAVGIIFGVAPAIRASRLDPIEALRYE